MKNLHFCCNICKIKIWAVKIAELQLKNAYSLAKIGADTAENERNFAGNFAKNWLCDRVEALAGARIEGTSRRPLAERGGTAGRSC